jgi:hypothetical protein
VLNSKAGRYANHPLGNAFCGAREFLNANHDCSAIVNSSFVDYFDEHCAGSSTCSISLANMLATTEKALWPEHCLTEETQFYAQIACELTTE